MTELQILILAGSLFVLSLIAIIVIMKKTPTQKHPIISSQKILNCFGVDNIVKVSYIRSKVNVTVNDRSKTDMNALKSAGAVGINIVGDTIKFYLENENETLFKELQQLIEGER